MAEELFRRTEEFDDGSFYRVVAYSVEPDEHYREGVKYSFQYCDQEDENVLRYDNSRHSTDIPKHHRHVGRDEEIEPVEYPGDIAAHLELFHTELHGLRKEGE